MSIKVYLSPSNQPNNLYTVGGTNEKLQMEDVAKRIKNILDSEYECEAMIATVSLSINSDGRPKEAKSKGCNVYLAIHSNAGGGGTASGAVAFFHPSISKSKALAESIVKELSAICPIKSNRSSAVSDGMSQFDGQGLAEVRNPSRLGIISVLAETNFHDNPYTANWIISNKDMIARAYVKALTDTLGIAKKKAVPISNTDAKPMYYKVQVGAFSKRDNAEAMLKKLKTAGFEGYIKFD